MREYSIGDEGFDNELSALVWRRKYRYGAQEVTVRDTWRRVAIAAASVDAQSSHWRDRFLAMLEGFRFLPAGRILASAGTRYDATLFNCFVMGHIDDSVAGILERLKESALTMQRGGGIGIDFSTLRPAGAPAERSGRIASGPVPFMRLWDAMCGTLLSGGNRRGAMMGVLRCDHPDILEFIDAKRTPGALTNFNLSVQVTDKFLRAVDANRAIRLLFPTGDATAGETTMIRWPGFTGPVPCAIHAMTSAMQLWRRIIDAAFDTAEPGVLFVDRINEMNNLYYCEQITTTNPCGEIPLPAFGACDLGSINLAAHVVSPYTPQARLDLDAIGHLARDAVRFLDNIVDLSTYPLEAQANQAHATRRIGLGITGLADALIMLNRHYDSDSGRELALAALTRIRNEAYGASIALAGEKGCFPRFDKEAYLAGKYVSSLPASIRDGIARQGIRNSHLLAIAPAGSISILANNVSSGIEPVFASTSERVIKDPDGTAISHEAVDHAYSQWLRSGKDNRTQPQAFVTAHELSPEAHLLMAATLQPLVDNSISKTVNVAADISIDAFRQIYKRAFDLGLKGCTVFRANPIRGKVLSALEAPEAIHCCALEREGD